MRVVIISQNTILHELVLNEVKINPEFLVNFRNRTDKTDKSRSQNLFNMAA